MKHPKRKSIHPSPKNSPYILGLLCLIIPLIIIIGLVINNKQSNDVVEETALLEASSEALSSTNQQTYDSQSTNQDESSQIVSSSKVSEQSESKEELKQDESEKNSNQAKLVEIYDLELMEATDLEFIDNIEDYHSVDEIVQYVVEETGASVEEISVAYYNLLDDSTYFLNETKPQIVASIYKVGLVAMYVDLINEGVYSYDTPVTVDERALSSSGDDVMLGTFTLDELMQQTILYSNNVTSWALIFHHFGSWSGYIEALSNFTDISSVADLAYQDNYLTSEILLNVFYKISQDPSYDYLIDLMHHSTPNQLFTAYVQEGMANKYGRLDNVVTDAGIYYEDDQPIYILVGLTDANGTGDYFLERLNLRINEWTRYNYLNNDD
ncbi:serine hydrolase [Aerococcaceae bacterium DSM 111020]|nr:serine hydrolase [Aerococcaceae bacterium DSM 111020]